MKNYKTVFISGNFNIIHPGHQRLFMSAKELGNKLIVGIVSDKIAKKNAYIKEKLRLETVVGISIVDEVILIKDSVSATIKKLKPDIVFKGKEYENNFNIELDIVNSYGGSLIFSSGETVFTSSELINNEISINTNSNLKKNYFKRHNIKKNNLLKLLNSFSKKKVLIIGDIIVDEYISCQALGMSQEDPTIAVKPLNKKLFLGGAGIVASHAAKLGADVKIYSVLGDDELNKFVTNELEKNGVKSEIQKDNTRPTPLKQRYRANGKTMLRVNHLHSENISKKVQDKFLKNLKIDIPNYDLLVFSDFNYGCIPIPLFKRILKFTLFNFIHYFLNNHILVVVFLHF